MEVPDAISVMPEPRRSRPGPSVAISTFTGPRSRCRCSALLRVGVSVDSHVSVIRCPQQSRHNCPSLSSLQSILRATGASDTQRLRDVHFD